MASCTIATMRKKLLTLLLTAFLALASLGASDFKFVFGGLDQHSEILFGFLPAYANAGGWTAGRTSGSYGYGNLGVSRPGDLS